MMFKTLLYKCYARRWVHRRGK